MQYQDMPAVDELIDKPLVRMGSGRYRVTCEQLSEADILAAADEIIEQRFQRRSSNDPLSTQVISTVNRSCEIL